jgi:hypothetical protein
VLPVSSFHRASRSHSATGHPIWRSYVNPSAAISTPLKHPLTRRSTITLPKATHWPTYRDSDPKTSSYVIRQRLITPFRYPNVFRWIPRTSSTRDTPRLNSSPLASESDVDGGTALSKRVQSASGGAPRWTYVLGAAVGTAGLFWTITSYFISHPARQDPASPRDSWTPSITVSGSGIGVGQMYGGQINQGSSPAGFPRMVKPER